MRATSATHCIPVLCPPYYLTNYMKQSHLWEANSFSASQHILGIYVTLCSLLYPQKPATCSYPEPDWHNQRHLIVFKMHFRITLPSAPRSSKWSSPVSFPPFILQLDPIIWWQQSTNLSIRLIGQHNKNTLAITVRRAYISTKRSNGHWTNFFRTALPPHPPTRGISHSNKLCHRVRRLQRRPGKCSRFISLSVPQNEPQSTV
jgi:hypothetical protein